jgi:LPXTG-motif cell wall-anchored protein
MKYKVLNGLMLFVIVMASVPVHITKAAPVVSQAEKSVFEIIPDLFLSGTEEEYDSMTFHELMLPADRKDTGILIALPVTGKGRVHYYIGVTTVESADIIKPEIFEDAAGTIPVKNQYESNEVYDYFYNFDVTKEETYYIKLTAPKYEGSEDLPLKFSAQYYSGQDRTLEPDVQSLPKTGEESKLYLYFGGAALCAGVLLILKYKRS